MNARLRGRAGVSRRIEGGMRMTRCMERTDGPDHDEGVCNVIDLEGAYESELFVGRAHKEDSMIRR